MTVKLDHRLNLSIPIKRTDGVLVHVHSTPIRVETFEQYFDVIGKSFTELFTAGYGSAAGPRVAYFLLKKIAQREQIWDGPEGVEKGLINELHRLTNVLVPTEQGWRTLPYHEAARDHLSAQDARDVENVLVFFMVASSMLRGDEVEMFLGYGVRLLGAELTLSSCTELAASLPRSTSGASTGETTRQAGPISDSKAPQSSIPH